MSATWRSGTRWRGLLEALTSRFGEEYSLDLRMWMETLLRLWATTRSTGQLKLSDGWLPKSWNQNVASHKNWKLQSKCRPDFSRNDCRPCKPSNTRAFASRLIRSAVITTIF